MLSIVHLLYWGAIAALFVHCYVDSALGRKVVMYFELSTFRFAIVDFPWLAISLKSVSSYQNMQ